MSLSTLHTGRLRLRPWTKDDVSTFHVVFGDPRVTWWETSHSPETSSRRMKGMLARCADMPEGMGWWAVEERDMGEVIGSAVLQPAPYDETAELGYHLAHAAWGHGFATEAAKAVLRHGFLTLELPVVTAVVHVENHASHQVAIRVGLREVGPKTFNTMPHLLYRLSREEAFALDWASPEI